MTRFSINEKCYEIIITYKCNWSCEYCSIDTHNKQKLNPINIENLIKKIRQIPKTDNLNIILSGGEPGMLEKNIFKTILKEILKLFSKDKEIRKNQKLQINTNGLVLQKYPKLIKKFFDIISYHCSADLNINDKILNCSYFNNKKIYYILIITDKNIIKLEEFINNNKDIKFYIVEGSDPFIHKSLLNSKYKMNIVKKFSKNIEAESKYYLMKKFNSFYDNVIYIN